MNKKRARATAWLALLLVFGLGATQASAATLRIISLECHTPEDAVWDEARLTVTGDGHDCRYRNHDHGSEQQ